jgi:hypothetical protein
MFAAKLVTFAMDESSAPSLEHARRALTSTAPAHVPFHYSIDGVISGYVHLSHILLSGFY